MQIEQMKAILGRTMDGNKQVSKPAVELPVSKDRVDGSSSLPSAPEKENQTKTTLISRIARLGQPILPLTGAIVAKDSSEDDSEQVRFLFFY